MSLIEYESWRPGVEAQETLRHANEICEDYADQGYDLTLRQLYYQFVARDLIPNTQKSYKRLGSIVNRGRLAGLLDWEHIVDRTRNLETLSHWNTTKDMIWSAANWFQLDRWGNQKIRIEVWVEKEALSGVIGQVAERHDVAWFACRGYVSQSELWRAAERLIRYVAEGQEVLVLHLGDHDPSGIDMTRDIQDRLNIFMAHGSVEVRRIALNMDQVDQYRPPPNPAKLTDSRAHDYIAKYGSNSWELDALDPATLEALIEKHILDARDDAEWNDTLALENQHKELLNTAHDRWHELVDVLEGDQE